MAPDQWVADTLDKQGYFGKDASRVKYLMFTNMVDIGDVAYGGGCCSTYHKYIYNNLSQQYTEEYFTGLFEAISNFYGYHQGKTELDAIGKIGRELGRQFNLDDENCPEGNQSLQPVTKSIMCSGYFPFQNAPSKIQHERLTQAINSDQKNSGSTDLAQWFSEKTGGSSHARVGKYPWVFLSGYPYESEALQIKSQYSGMCLGVESASVGSRIIQVPCSSDDQRQHFRLKYTKGGYKFENVKSYLCITAKSLEPKNTSLHLNYCSIDENNQIFDQGKFDTFELAHNALCLSVQDQSKKVGAFVNLRACASEKGWSERELLENGHRQFDLVYVD